jgi:glyoxylase-like metal-dependent hydrolase (beta-lactamase superfamily II)
MTETPEFKSAMEFAYAVPRELAPGVVRLVANNPSPFTYNGTNSYLVGRSTLALIDPGPGDPVHEAAIMTAAAGRPITHIVITHTHRDHTDGLPAMLKVTGAKTAGYGHKSLPRATGGASLTRGEYVERNFVPDIVMRDGDRLEGGDWSLDALFTPGHAPDHLCFALGGTDILFSGDHVMAWNTSVVAPPEGHMGAYVASLEKLLPRTDRVYFPGHGGQLESPQKMVRAFLVHRRMREQAILEAIQNGQGTIRDVVGVVYKGLDAKLLNAAALSVAAHVVHLSERGLARISSPPSTPLGPETQVVALGA